MIKYLKEKLSSLTYSKSNINNNDKFSDNMKKNEVTIFE